MPAPLMKILALQFKYFGDAVLMTPALRALRGHFPAAEIHLLAPEEMAPLFQHLPWLNRVWPMPRRRGSASLRETWPLIRALRNEKFDRSVDFASNDRGAILSFLIGAKNRLGWDERGGFVGRKFFYTERVAPEAVGRTCRSSEAAQPHGRADQTCQHESAHLAQLLSGWQIPPPASLEPEIRSDPALADAAKKILPVENAIVCHVASSQPRKEWPLQRWAEFYRLATAAGQKVVFTTARGDREAALMRDLKTCLDRTGKTPVPLVLPEIAELPLFLAVLARAGIFISGDTGPVHFAAGLGVPTISLFGPTSPERWRPIGARHQVLIVSNCSCQGNTAICSASRHCLLEISPEKVLAATKLLQEPA
jgi:heptosyltransferase III